MEIVVLVRATVLTPPKYAISNSIKKSRSIQTGTKFSQYLEWGQWVKVFLKYQVWGRRNSPWKPSVWFRLNLQEKKDTSIRPKAFDDFLSIFAKKPLELDKKESKLLSLKNYYTRKDLETVTFITKNWKNSGNFLRFHEIFLDNCSQKSPSDQRFQLNQNFCKGCQTCLVPNF